MIPSLILFLLFSQQGEVFEQEIVDEEIWQEPFRFIKQHASKRV